MNNINYSLINNNLEKLESSFMDGLLFGFTLASLLALYLASRAKETKKE